MERFDAATNLQIDEVVRLVGEVLGDGAEAGYLFGSAVHGGLRPDSDLDLLFIATRRTNENERRALIDGFMSISRSRGDADGRRHLEVTIVVHSDIRPWRYPPPMEFQYGDWWRPEFQAGDLAPWTSPNADLAVILTAVRSEGVPLFGPPAVDSIEAIPRDDLDRAMRDVVPDLLQELDGDTRNVLLTLARVWFTLETGVIESKGDAADWALERLPDGRGDALRLARDAYLGATTHAWIDPAAISMARADAEAIVQSLHQGSETRMDLGHARKLLALAEAAPAKTGAPLGTIRLATQDDADAIDELMKQSIGDLFPQFYDERQTASSIVHIGSVDRMLIADGTYFVVEDAGELIACGGWSRRDKLYTGSGEGSGDARLLDPAKEPARVRAMFVRPDRTRRGLGTRILEACEAAAAAERFRVLALMATLPGLQLYERYGFMVTERTSIPLPDGVTIGGAAMQMPIRQPSGSTAARAT